MVIVSVLTLAVVAAIVVVVVGFDKLRNAEVAAQESLVDLDLQLVRRADLVTQLAEALRGHASPVEVGAAADAARQQVDVVAAASDVRARVEADSRLTQALACLGVAAQALTVPSVRCAVEEVQRMLAATEGSFEAARQHYDGCVRKLNRAVSTVPWMFVAGLAAVVPRELYSVVESGTGQPDPRLGAAGS